MRRTALVVLLLAMSAISQADVAPTTEDYYRGKAARAEVLPSVDTYLRVLVCIRRYHVEPISDQALARGVCAEVDRMLAAIGLRLDLRGVPRDLDYPYAVSLQGRLSPGLLWLAACHGLVIAADPRGGEFLTQAEYDGLQCGGYYGPPRHPGY